MLKSLVRLVLLLSYVINTGLAKKGSTTAERPASVEYKLPEQISAKFTELLENITETKESLGEKKVPKELKTSWGAKLYEIVDLGNTSMVAAAEDKEEAVAKRDAEKKDKKDKKDTKDIKDKKDMKEKKEKKSRRRRLRRRRRRM